MPGRTIEETFRAVTPRYRRGIPEPPTISVGFRSGGTSAGATGTTDLSTSLSQAGQQITQLKQAYQQQATLIAANTQAVQGNTSAQGSRSGTSVGSVASSVFGGALGFLSPVISGIEHLFGGGQSTPPPLPIYTPPPSVAISGSLTPAPANSVSASSTAAPSQVTVNISAMDSQSILDRSSDIASAVQYAMLSMHPINSVIANL